MLSATTTQQQTQATTKQQAAKWTLDNSHSSVTFSVRHLMITNVKGEFQKVSGSAFYDPAKPEATKLEAVIDVASINTREPQRDTHLKSADFFDAEKFPTITFVSKSARGTGKGEIAITGDLTIHGVTREVVLAVSDIADESTDPWGNLRIGASASTKIKRSDYGMTWNSVVEAGGVLVGDEVKIQLDVSLIKQK
jgi:polyisoprenoid-binding protein YceI